MTSQPFYISICFIYTSMAYYCYHRESPGTPPPVLSVHWEKGFGSKIIQSYLKLHASSLKKKRQQ